MKHKALWVIAIIFFVFALGLFYVNKVLLPVQLKGMIIKSAEEALHRKVNFDTIQWGPLKGLAVTNLTVYSPENPEEVFVHIEKASAQVLFFPLFNRKVIVPWATIEKPSIRLARLTPDTWSFSDLLKSGDKAAAASKVPAPDVLIGKLIITGGRLKVVDNASPETFTELIEPINIRGTVSLAAGLHLTGNIALPATKGLITFDTRTNLRNGSFKGEIQVNKMSLGRYVRFIPNLPVVVRGADIEQANLTIHFQEQELLVSGDGNLPVLEMGLPQGPQVKTAVQFEKTTLSFAPGNLSLQGKVTTRSTLLALDEQKRLEGDLHVNIDKLTQKGNDLAFEGDLTGDKLRFTLDPGRFVSGSLRMNDARLNLKGPTLTAVTALEFKNFFADLGPQLKISGEVSCPQLKAAQDSGALTVMGDLKAKKFLMDLSEGNKITGELTLKQTKLSLGVKNINLTGDLSFDGLQAALPGALAKGNVSAPGLNLSLADDKIDGKFQVDVKNGEVALPQSIVFRGAPSLTLHLTADAAFQKPEYAGTLILEDAALTGLPTIGKAENIRGKITIETDKVLTKDLTLSVLSTPVAVTGEVRHFAKPVLDLNASALKVDLALAEKVIPEILKANGLKVSGTADVSAHVSGLANRLDQADIAADAKLYDVNVTSEKLKQDVQKINGTLELTTPTLSWKDLSFLYQGRRLVLDGYLKDFQNPYIATSLKADDIAADIQAKKTGEVIRIESFSGSWFDSSVNLSGKVDLIPDKAPAVTFVADGKLSLRDLEKMLPQEQAKDLAKLNLSGVVKINASVKGNPADWQRLNANVALDAAAVYVMGYQVEDLKVKAVQKDGVVDPLDIKGKVYGGNVGIVSSVNLEKKNYPFETSFKASSVDIAQLKNDTPLKDRELSGIINSTGNLKGSALDWKPTLQGKTTVEIAQGHLLEVEILSKLLSIVSTSFQGGDMVITDASAMFEIGDGKITTNNLTLKSPAVTLLAEGWMDFDQNIDLNVTPSLQPGGNTGTAVGVLEAINPTAGLLNIRITGTVTKPQFNHNVSAPTMIKKTLQNTVGNILKIFE